MRCTSKAISGGIEDVVWRDIETFLRNPGVVLKELAARIAVTADSSAEVKAQLAVLKAALTGKEDERNRVLGLFRRGRIDDAVLDKQLDEVERERAALGRQVEELESKRDQSREVQARLATAGDLLRELNRRLDRPLSWQSKRRVVETLVESIRVEPLVKV